VFENAAQRAVELGLRGTLHTGTLALPEKIRGAARHASDLQALSRIASGDGGMVARHDQVIEGHVPPGGAAGDRTAVTGEIGVADSDLVFGVGVEGPVAVAENPGAAADDRVAVNPSVAHHRIGADIDRVGDGILRAIV